MNWIGWAGELFEYESERQLHKSISLSLMGKNVFGGDNIQIGTIPEGSGFDKARAIGLELSRFDYSEIKKKGAVVVDYDLGEIQGKVTIQDGDAAF